jgi:hypothetical protein
LEPDDRWKEVTYRVFDSPSPFQFCGAGKINKGNNWKEFEFPTREAIKWFKVGKLEYIEDVIGVLPELANEVVKPCYQNKLSINPLDQLAEYHVNHPDAEGLIIRRPDSFWQARRADYCQKVLITRYDEARVVDWKYGTGKYSDVVGAIQMEGEIQGVMKTFWLNIRGDELRTPSHWPNGKVVRYAYMEVTPDGKPRNPRIADE